MRMQHNHSRTILEDDGIALAQCSDAQLDSRLPYTERIDALRRQHSRQRPAPTRRLHTHIAADDAVLVLADTYGSEHALHEDGRAGPGHGTDLLTLEVRERLNACVCPRYEPVRHLRYDVDEAYVLVRGVLLEALGFGVGGEVYRKGFLLAFSQLWPCWPVFRCCLKIVRENRVESVPMLVSDARLATPPEESVAVEEPL